MATSESVERRAFGVLPAPCLELVAMKVSFFDRLRMVGVNRHWREVLVPSLNLWRSVSFDLEGHSCPERTESVLSYVASRPRGIHDLDVTVQCNDDYASLGFLLGTLRPVLRRLSLVAGDPELQLHSSASFLYQLTALTLLELEHCVHSLEPSVSCLAGLRELRVRGSGVGLGEGPTEEVTALTNLTRLEFVEFAPRLPIWLASLTALRHLSLEGTDMSEDGERLASLLPALCQLEHLDLSDCSLPELPPSISALSALTSFRLDSAFDSAARLAPLSSLSALAFLDLRENELFSLPDAIASLPGLDTLKLTLNPLRELPDGPYLANLTYLDLRGARLATLPQYLTQATRLKFLGLACCHNLSLTGELAESVLGRLPSLTALTLCGQQMGTLESARCMVVLGRLLPSLSLVSHGDSDDDSYVDEDEGEEDFEDEYEDEEDFEGETDFDSDEEGYDDSDAVSDDSYESDHPPPANLPPSD